MKTTEEGFSEQEWQWCLVGKQEDDRNGDFYELCKKEGLEFQALPVFYYKK